MVRLPLSSALQYQKTPRESSDGKAEGSQRPRQAILHRTVYCVVQTTGGACERSSTVPQRMVSVATTVQQLEGPYNDPTGHFTALSADVRRLTLSKSADAFGGRTPRTPKEDPQHAALSCRMWTALQACSRCTGVVVIHRRQCVMHCGVARAGHLPGRAALGPIAEAAIKKGSPTYMANLILFPGQASHSMSSLCHAHGLLH